MSTDAETAPYRRAATRTLQLAIWMLAWLLTLAAARFGPALWVSPIASWVAVAANVIVGLGLIIAFTRYLRSVDDLDRKIMLDALAVTLGVGWVGGFAWIVADGAELIATDIAAGVFPAALGLVFLGAVVAGRIRYR